MEDNQLEQTRRNKMSKWEVNYDFKVTSNCNISNFKVGDVVRIAGRIIFFRDLGKIVFAKLKDFHGTAQFSLKYDVIENFKELKTILDMGDFIGIEGDLYKTEAGELTIQVTTLKTLRKAILPLPDKWRGIQDDELKVRYRYLDLIGDENAQKTMLSRFQVLRSIRQFLITREFIEVETPILQPIASGAAANPFLSFYDAQKQQMYLRIAPELYLKRLLIAGFTKVFEIAKCFRNEGIDTTHLPEFTMLEFYQAYISYEELQNMAIELLQCIVKAINPSLIIDEMDFNDIPKLSYIEFLKTYGDIDFDKLEEEGYIESIAKKNEINLSGCKSHQAKVDMIYKHCCVKKIISPVLVYNYPRSALSKPCYEDMRFSEQFQIILKQQEVVKSCLEMNDPDIQQANFEEQNKFNESGDNDIVRTDMDFIEALKFGMPPAGGLGLGIDRITTILTRNQSIRNVIFFPAVKKTIQK